MQCCVILRQLRAWWQLKASACFFHVKAYAVPTALAGVPEAEAMKRRAEEAAGVVVGEGDGEGDEVAA